MTNKDSAEVEELKKKVASLEKKNEIEKTDADKLNQLVDHRIHQLIPLG